MSSDLIPAPHQAPHVQQNNCTSPDNMAAATALHHGHQHAGYPSAATSDHPHLLGPHHVPPHVGPHQGAGAAYTNSSSPHSPPTTSVAAPPPPTSNCSSSSVAELQRLSDSMGPAPPPAPPHSIARSNIFLSRERDTEMKINDKISSQSIKQNERSALKGQIK